MRARFVHQPLADGSDLAEFLVTALSDSEIDDLLVVVAWAKRSGLRIFDDLIADFRARGGRALLLVGVSEGGATRQGLDLAMRLFNEVWVVHDVGGRTFHPKVYVARSQHHALALVGSHNLTRGGAFANFEAGIVMDLDLREPEDRVLIDDIDEFVAGLLDDEATTVRLSEDVLRRLLSDPSLRIGDEDAGRRGAEHRPDSDSVSGVDRGTPSGVFRPSGKPRRPVPSVLGPPRREPVAPTRSQPLPAPRSAQPRRSARVAHRWTKRLSHADAQTPGPGTNPTGHLTLVQAGHGIDPSTYFRNSLFAGAAWAGGARGREEASLQFEVFIRGAAIGTVTIRVTHTPAFEADQGNRTTVLHWGQQLAARLRQVDYAGDYVSIEVLDDGSYRLTIDETPTGPFLR